MPRSVILVGHCGIDGPRLQREISSNVPETDVVRCNSAADLDRCCNEGADLLLVNREPVGFDQDGLAIVRQVHEQHPDLKVMLVSDYPEAQEEAVKAGAMQGFGKSLMGSPQFAEKVKAALGE